MKFDNFNSLFDLLTAFPNEQACVEHLESLRWPDGIISPFDPTSKVYNYGNNIYRCKNTQRKFNVKTNTIFHNTKLPLRKWYLAIWLITTCKKGISSEQLARDLKITQKSAWFMLQRIRGCYFCENQSKLDNAVELDETFVGGKNKNRHWNKKVKNSQGRSFKDKVPVLGMLQRGGKLVCRVVKNTNQKQLTYHIIKNIKRSATLYTDEWRGYNFIGKLYTRLVVDHKRKQYVNGDASTNCIEGFWSIMKRGLICIYNHTSKKHLQRYVNEYVFRYNTRNMDAMEQFNLLLCNLEYRITYKQLTA